MRVIIAGGRDIHSRVLVETYVDESHFHITEVVYGGANGVDRIGAAIAKHRGIPVIPFKPDWDTHGRAAGPIRNRLMAEYADALILIWDGKSKGSSSMKREAVRAGIPIFERIVDPAIAERMKY